MSVARFKPAIWSATILRTNEDNLIAQKICNTTADGVSEIKQKGDTVYFPGLADPTVTAYTGSINYEALQDAGCELQIDQSNYFAFKVGDIDKAQASADLKNSQATRASYQLKKTCDSYILGKYADAKYAVDNSGSSLSITSLNIISSMGMAAQKLMEESVPENGIFMVIPPWVQLKLKLAGINFKINEGINGTGGMAWTKELGFDVYVTNNVANTGTSDVPISHCLAGSMNSMVYAEQILETEALRLQTSFDNAVRGLHVFGHKIVKPNELVHMNFTYAAESAI